VRPPRYEEKMRRWMIAGIGLCWICAAVCLKAEDLAAAERALESRQLRLATEQFEALLASSPEGETGIRTRIGLARVYVLSGRLPDAENVLKDLPAIGDPVWSARASLVAADLAQLQGNTERAEALLASLPETLGNDLWDLRGLRLQARVIAAAGRTEEALILLADRTEPELLQERAALLAANDQQDVAVTLWGELANGDMKEVSTQDAKLALAELAVQAGDWETAGKRLQELLEKGGVYEELEPRAYPLFVRLYSHQQDYGQAVAYLEALEKRLVDPARLTEARAYRSEALIRAGRLEEAATLLQELIAKVGDHPLVAESQLLLARTRVEAGETEAARDAFAVYLSVFTDPEGVAEALVGQARMEETLERWTQAEALYARAAAAFGEEEAQRIPLVVKRADMAMSAGQAEQAYQIYDSVLAEDIEHELKGHIMFHAAVALFEADRDRLRDAVRRLRELRVEMPQDPFAEKALLQIAMLQQEAGQFSPALGSFTSYLSEYPQGAYVADAMVDKGISAYRNNYYKIALAQFEQVMEAHPEHPRAEQAISLRGWMLYLMGRDQEAREVGERFLEAYPDSEYEPHVRLWLAGMSFNRGLYEQAEEEFTTLAEKAAEVDVQIQGLYYAGRAALARKAYDQALERFTSALERAGESGEETLAMDYVQESLFYKGDAQTELDRFDEAIVTFNRFITQYPDSYLRYAAVGRRGDCQFTLGESNRDRYLEALDSYRQVTEASSVRPDVQLQALYKLGRTQMALEREEEAFRTYQQVMDRYLKEKARMGSDAGIWFVRAVTDAAQAREDREEYREAVRIYSFLAETSLPQADEARRRMRELREKHQLLQFQGEQP